MAQLLQPLFILLLSLTLVFHPKGVKSLEYANYASIIDLKNTLEQNQLKVIWNTQFKELVKQTDPKLLRSRKRGKRAGVRVSISKQQGKVPLPAILLTNANSVCNKLDEIHGLLRTKRLQNLSHVVCITESWLNPNIAKSRTELDGYEQFRNDRLPADSGKAVGGGILMYIDKCWSTNNQKIYSHTDNHCEIMTIKSRPHWLPREFSSVISISCYTPFTGGSRRKDTAKSTVNTISSHLSEMETKYPDACILLMGDFNQLPIKLNNYYQVVNKPTRNNRVLDKCYTRVKNGYSHCHQLAQLGNSDHYVMHLIPSYKPLSRIKPKYTSCRKYSDENCEALQACFDTTLWDNLITDEQDIDSQTEVITDYIRFCTDLCIPTTSVKKHANHKPWVTKYIQQLIEQKQTAHHTGNKKLYHKLKKVITKRIAKSRVEYARRTQQRLISEPAQAWKDIKKLSGLPSRNSSDCDIKYKPDELNTFFARYEKSDIKRPTINKTKVTAPPFEVHEHAVLKQLKTLNIRKGAAGLMD